MLFSSMTFQHVAFCLILLVTSEQANFGRRIKQAVVSDEGNV